ncbi:hypothetical protein RHMOL_Rhmol08G0168200 [Rhododendron molle]|uniref:Uncharacterized protein n=2 Tax=Rhododendron molle TaxID=49168 RepID=A0ACC0MPI5_RHOML|nr:hypothetical protein RHMOL_Rhmol08G0168200 [Rhododendron molle]KAI8542805.1 hypothetical protein RHMOL_Rhmol08G0168200 [Rhododendron molle]
MPSSRGISPASSPNTSRSSSRPRQIGALISRSAEEGKILTLLRLWIGRERFILQRKLGLHKSLRILILLLRVENSERQLILFLQFSMSKVKSHDTLVSLCLTSLNRTVDQCWYLKKLSMPGVTEVKCYILLCFPPACPPARPPA